MKYKICRKAGRCSNGAELDSGSLAHAVPVGSWKAICGTEPGRTSAGWSSHDEPEVTCQRCAAKLQRLLAKEDFKAQ